MNDDETKAENIEVPVGEWVDVPPGMIAVTDCYVDPAGTLRYTRDGSMAVWHWRRKDEMPCNLIGFTPKDVVYLKNGAPWCPECLERKQNWEVEKLLKAFGEAIAKRAAEDIVPGQDDTP